MKVSLLIIIHMILFYIYNNLSSILCYFCFSIFFKIFNHFFLLFFFFNNFLNKIIFKISFLFFAIARPSRPLVKRQMHKVWHKTELKRKYNIPPYFNYCWCCIRYISAHILYLLAYSVILKDNTQQRRVQVLDRVNV